MLKNIVITLLLFMQIVATHVQAQPFSGSVEQVSTVTNYSLNESALLASQLQSSVAELRALGLRDEQILKALEQKILSDASLVSVGGVVKAAVGFVGVLILSGAIGAFVGAGLGLQADELEANIHQALIHAQNH